jgi:DNA-binding MarR family transcriptional regulator
MQSALSSKFSQWTEIFLRRSMQDFIRFARSRGLSMIQINTLFQLHHHGCASVSDVAGRFSITNPAASQLIDRLVQQGYVERAEDPSDRRHKQICLSPAGATLLQEAIAARNAWPEDIIPLLSPDEQAQVLSALTILLDKVQLTDANELNHG